MRGRNDNLRRFADRYSSYMEVLNRSPETIRSYRWHLSRFPLYLEERNITDIMAVTPEAITDYQKHLHYALNRYRRQDSVRTQNNHLRVVKSFFRFLKDEDYLPNDPARDVPYATEPKSLPKVILTRNEVKKILKAPDTSTILGYRDRTILEVLYSTGIRRDELRNSRLNDLDLEGGYLRVNRGKGEKDRVVPVGRIASRYLENYIKGVRPELLKDPQQPHLFLSKHGRKMSKNILGDLILKYTRLAGVNKHVTAHTWRHTCATHLIRNRANLRHVQMILGHQSLNTTQKYIQLTITDLKEAHRKYHPREKDKF